MRTTRRFVALLLGAGVAVACVPKQRPRQVSEVVTEEPPTIASVSATPRDGPQFAASDAPSSGKASARPKMSAAALQAYAAGLQAFQNGDLEGARAQFGRAGAADPKAFQAFYSLGVVRERLGDLQGALSAYRRALNVVNDYEPAIVAYAMLLARSGRTSEAAGFLNEKQSRMGRSAAVVAALAEVKSLEGDSGEAQRLAQEALKRNPDYRPAMETLARDHYRNRRLDLALYSLRGILDGYGQENPPRDKNNAQARLLRGLIYKEQGLRRESIEELRRAIALRPDLVEARIHLASYLLESGNAAEAAMLLEGALRYDKLNVLARLNLGDAYRLLGKTAEAVKELEWVLLKDPSIAQAHYDLGLLYMFSASVPGLTRTQAMDRAIQALEEYRTKHPRGQGGPDDADELISRARSMKAQIEAEQQAGPPAPPPVAAGPAAAKPPPGQAPASQTPAGKSPSGQPPVAGQRPASPPAGSAPPASPPPQGRKPGDTNTGALPPAPDER